MLVAAENGKISGEQSMNPPYSSIVIAESRRFCRRLSKKSGSNFLWAFPTLTKHQRRAMYSLYAYMRFTDDLIDDVPSFDGISTSVKQSPASNLGYSPKDRLKQWRLFLKIHFPFCIALTSEENRAIKSDLVFDEQVLNAVLLFPSLIESAERFQIPQTSLFAVLDGVEMDLTKNRYPTFKELELYCERVASAVGLACIHIWGFKGRGTPEQENVFELARKVGIAYQLTNILRDIKEDAEMDRVYLPLDEISSAGYSVGELNSRIVNPAFERLMRSQIDRTEEYYQASRELYLRLKPQGKKIFGLMTSTYHSILKKIAANPAAVFTQRIRPSAFERIRLVAKWTCTAPKELLL
jgi:15-cis-phytoene synthase